MAHGFPDWGEYAPQDLVSKSMDTAELAARLGSPFIFDRQGTVIFHDDFGCGDSKWCKSYLSPQRIYPSAAVSFSGGYSLAFYDDGQQISPPSIYVNIPVTLKTPIGSEGGFNFTSVWGRCELKLYVFYEGVLSIFGIRYKCYDKTVELYGPYGSYITLLTDVDVPTGYNSWFTFKLVVNPSAGKYERLRINNKIYDLSAYSCYSESTVNPDHIEAIYGVGTTYSEPETHYMGYAIITQNE